MKVLLVAFLCPLGAGGEAHADVWQRMGHLPLVLTGTSLSCFWGRKLRAEAPPDQELLAVSLLWALTDFGF